MDDPGSERLVRVEHDGELTLIDGELTLSNGIAWSPNGKRLYQADTFAGIVWVRTYDPLTGAVGERRELIRVAEGDAPKGYPDGICVDRLGNLWVAIWGAGEIRCYSPDAVQLHTVTVDAPNTSSVAFVGEHLDLLLITTARELLDEAQLARYPLSGHLFTASVGVTGVPTTPWSGSWAPVE